MHIAGRRREIVVVEKATGRRWTTVRVELLRRLVADQWLIALLLRETIEGACQLLAEAEQVITVLALVIRAVRR